MRRQAPMYILKLAMRLVQKLKQNTLPFHNWYLSVNMLWALYVWRIMCGKQSSSWRSYLVFIQKTSSSFLDLKNWVVVIASQSFHILRRRNPNGTDVLMCINMVGCYCFHVSCQFRFNKTGKIVQVWQFCSLQVPLAVLSQRPLIAVWTWKERKKSIIKKPVQI